jgi:hypothetical protein
MFRHGHRLAALQTRLQHAALVMVAVLAAVFVTQVDLDPCDGIGKSRQRMLDDLADTRDPCRMPWNIGVGIDLDFHVVLLK